jgi:hypothetical protein
VLLVANARKSPYAHNWSTALESPRSILVSRLISSVPSFGKLTFGNSEWCEN